MRTWLYAVALLLGGVLAPLAAGAQTPGPATPTPAVSPAPPPSAALTARAKDWLHRLETADIDRSQLTDEMNTKLTPDLAKQVSGQVSSLGDPTDFAFVDVRTLQGNEVYRYRVTFKSGALFWIFATDANGKVSGMQFVPIQQ
jgi:hypothetical protein